jgi:FAD/FMN-containing dehydrogenase
MIEFHGSVYRPNDPGYEAARRGAVWNAIKPKRFPAVIVVAGSHDDVPKAVALAREEGLSIGIRSGGHNWVGNALRDAGLLLDLSKLKGLEIDQEARTATIEPGVRVRDLEQALTPLGLYFPVGHCPTVGLTGYILGGGGGLNSREIGLGAFNMYALDMVNAHGEVLHITDESHPDIMWAARGSGPGFFGVVTRFYLELRPLPDVVALSLQVHPFAAFDELVAWDAQAGFPALVIVGINPTFGPDPVLIVVGYAFADTIEEATEKLAVLETAPNLDRAIVHQVAQHTSLGELYAFFDQMYPEGIRYLSDNVWIKDTNAPGLWDDVRAVFESLPTQGSTGWLMPDFTPIKHPNASFSLSTDLCFQAYAAYEDSAQDEEMLAWHNGAMARIDKYSIGGGYVGDSNLYEHPMAVLDPDSAARLEQLRKKYDPDGLFDSYPSELPPARL